MALCEGALLAPHTYSGTMKASVFEDWLENKLLSCLPQRDIIIMDNAAFHKKEVLQNLAGKYSKTLIFLPPYSSEYNPIEHTWKALTRNIAGQIHLHSPVATALDAIVQGK